MLVLKMARRNRTTVMNGIIDDIRKIIRPVDAQGNPLPVSTVEIALSNEATIKLGLIVAGGIFLNKMID